MLLSSPRRPVLPAPERRSVSLAAAAASQQPLSNSLAKRQGLRQALYQPRTKGNTPKLRPA